MYYRMMCIGMWNYIVTKIDVVLLHLMSLEDENQKAEKGPGESKEEKTYM